MSTLSQPSRAVHTLQCREIWGGFEAADSGVSVPGIDAWVLSRPFQGAPGGGDIHYVGLCGRGMLSRFLVADVAGHGESVVEVASDLRGVMSRHMNTPDQTQLVRSINDAFARRVEEGGFATAVAMTYQAADDVLVVVNAGHPEPLWYSASTGRWRILTHAVPESVGELTDLPLGIIPGTGYYQFAVPLGRGDLVVLYTDSLIEAFDDRQVQLGQRGLLAVAESLDPARHESFNHDLVEAVTAYGGGPPADDVTVLTLHHNARDPAE